MLKTLLAGTAAAALLAFGALAQESPAANETAPPVLENDAGAPATEAPDAAQVPESTTDDAAPTDTAQPAAPDAATDAPADVATPAPAPERALPEGAVPVDLATLTPDTLMGADILGQEGDTIASVDEVLMSAEGRIDKVIARFGGLLGFGETKVMLAPEEMAAYRTPDGLVVLTTNHTADALKSMPEYIAPEPAPAG